MTTTTDISHQRHKFRKALISIRPIESKASRKSKSQYDPDPGIDNMLGAWTHMYKVCLICFVEALKIIGGTLATVIKAEEANHHTAKICNNNNNKNNNNNNNTNIRCNEGKIVREDNKSEAVAKPSRRPTVPFRSKSKVITTTTKLKINQSWLKKSAQQAKEMKSRKDGQVERRRCSTYPGAHPAADQRQQQQQRCSSSFGRSLNLSRRFINRRHSYPPFKSILARVPEEDEVL